MKKWLAFLLLCALVLTGCTAGDGEDPAVQQNEYILGIQQRILDENCLMAVAYLGSFEGDYVQVTDFLEESGAMEALPVLQLLNKERYVEAQGSELYLVVPGEGVKLTVSDYVFDMTTGVGATDEVRLTEKSGLPILLKGNVSDIMPNLMVAAEKDGAMPVLYNPCRSLMDGSLQGAAGVLDISPYSILGVEKEAESVPFTGDWLCLADTFQGYDLQLFLSIFPDGHATYYYGMPESEVAESFEGTWTVVGDSLTLDLYGGPIAYGNDTPRHYSKKVECAWGYNGTVFSLLHRGGDPFFEGGDGMMFDFTHNFDPAPYLGYWETYKENAQTGNVVYYNVMFDINGKAYYSVSDVNGAYLIMSEGGWFVQNGELTLELSLYGGTEYSAGRTAVGGRYAIVNNGDGSLTLTLLSGDALTYYMEEDGVDTLFYREY